MKSNWKAYTIDTKSAVLPVSLQSCQHIFSNVKTCWSFVGKLTISPENEQYYYLVGQVATNLLERWQPMCWEKFSFCWRVCCLVAKLSKFFNIIYKSLFLVNSIVVGKLTTLRSRLSPFWHVAGVNIKIYFQFLYLSYSKVYMRKFRFISIFFL